MIRETRTRVIALLFTVATVILIAKVSEPDFMRTMRMRSSRQLGRAAQSSALACVNIADWADDMYKKDCL